MPVSMLTENQPCLVVGGGNVATRKVKSLLKAGAKVTVVCPDLCDALQTLLAAEEITFIPEPFDPKHLARMFLVFAATNQKYVNKEVIAAAKKQHVICCSAGSNWVESDFTSVASIRKHDLTISVSSDGHACRKSKLIKESFSRHLEMIETANLLVIGTSHEYLSVEEREPFHLLEEKIDQVGSMLMQVWGIHEFMILNTCNRVELIAVVADEVDRNGILERIMGFDKLAANHYYIKRAFDAFTHVAKMTAGLYSQIPGENHIANQVKIALSYAAEQGWSAGMIQQWMSAALHIAKDIRQVSSEILKSFEIEDLALEFIKETVTKTNKVMVIGTGAVGKDLVKRYTQQGIPCDWIYHRNQPQIDHELVNVYQLQEMGQHLSSCNVIICATSSPQPVVTVEHVKSFSRTSATTVIDLAMPRNVAPELGELNMQVIVADLEDLKHWYRKNLADLDHILQKGKEITYEHKAMYDKLIDSFQGGDEK